MIEPEQSVLFSCTLGLVYYDPVDLSFPNRIGSARWVADIFESTSSLVDGV